MSTPTPNMKLTTPTIGVDSGLTWETAINANSSIIDGHNHSPGNGALIQPNGLNINSSLTFNNFPATNLQACTFTPQTSLLTINTLYVSGVDLYYNDGSGNPPIPITSGGAVNASSSGIVSGTATASFSAGVLVVNAASNTPANIQGGSLLLGNNSSGSKFLTLAPPAAMASDFGLTLPSVPGSQSFMSIDTSGNIAAYAAVSGGITRSNLAAVGQQISSSCGSFTTSSVTFVSVTNLSVTLTTSGRPVMVLLYGIDTSSGIGLSVSSAGVYNVLVEILRGATLVGGGEIGADFGGGTPQIFQSPQSITILDTPSSGTYTYSVKMRVNTGAVTGAMIDMVLAAYEL